MDLDDTEVGDVRVGGDGIHSHLVSFAGHSTSHLTRIQVDDVIKSSPAASSEIEGAV